MQARRQATEEYKNAILQSYQKNIENFGNEIKGELDQLLATVAKDGAKVTTRNLGRIRNFCARITRMNTELKLDGMDTFIAQLLEKTYACHTTDDDDKVSAQASLSKFITKTQRIIEKDSERIGAVSRTAITPNSQKQIFKNFQQAYSRTSTKPPTQRPMSPRFGPRTTR